MERLCPNCGALVEGDGIYCQFCGGSMEKAVDLSKGERAQSAAGSSAGAGGQQSFVSERIRAVQNRAYDPTVFSNGADKNEEYKPMTTWQWVGTIILANLGIIGLVLLIYWAISPSVPQPKKNFAKGHLVISVIIFAISIISIISIASCIAINYDGSWNEAFRDIFGEESSNTVFV